MVLNDNLHLQQLTRVKLKNLKAGDLFILPSGVVFVKYSECEITNIRKDIFNVMPITGPAVGHHCAMNTESIVYVCKDKKDWYR